METLEFLSSTPIINNEDKGNINISKIEKAKSFRIKKRRLIQFENYLSGIEGLKEFGNANNLSISYRKTYEGIRYDIKYLRN